MRVFALLLLLGSAAPSCFSADAPTGTSLKVHAISTVAGNKQALFKVRPESSPDSPVETWFLRVGESRRGITLSALDPATGVVEIEENKKKRTLALERPDGAEESGVRGVLWLANATPADAFILYQQITTRTLLRDSSIDMAPISFRAQDLDTPAAADQLTLELKANDIELLGNGKRFAIATKAGASLPSLPNYDHLVNHATPTGSARVGAGEINFPRIALEPFLDFYAELTGRTLLRPSTLPNVDLSLQTETELNLHQAIYALDMLMALNGVKSTFLGERFVLITAQDHDTSRFPQPPAKAAEGPAIPRGHLNFTGSPGIHRAVPVRKIPLTRKSPGSPQKKTRPGRSATAEFDRILQFYATLTGKSLSASESLPAVSIQLRNMTDLASNEAAYAIESALRLNGILIKHTDEKTVTAMALAETNPVKP